MYDVIGIGSAFIDYFFEGSATFLKKYNLTPESDVLFSDSKITLSGLKRELPLLTKSTGGMSFNTVSVVKWLGGSAIWKGRPGKKPICACIITDGGKKRAFVVEANKGEKLFFKNINVKSLNKTNFLHISPFFGENMQAEFIELEKLFKKISAKISFTPSIYYCNFGIKKLTSVLFRTHILFTNKYEMGLLIKGDPKRASKKMLKYGPKIVICTLGAKGVLITTTDTQFFVNSEKVSRVVDSTGAGDAYAAGFLYAIVNNRNLKTAAKFGNNVAAISLSQYGTSWLNKKNKKLLHNIFNSL